MFLSHPYPLDYGEGPLLSQVRLLVSGTPVWNLYRDPSEPPYAVVNYPPLYPLTAATLSHLTGDVLLAGRVVSLLAAGGTVVALFLLSSPETSGGKGGHRSHWLHPLHRWLMVLLLFTIPIMREWSVVMRVDMLGVCLGLWGLVALRSRRPVVAGGGFLLSLFTKPSLLAAPLAGGAWLILEALREARSPAASPGPPSPLPGSPPGRWAWRAGVLVLVVLTIGGGGVLVLLQWASNGWFVLHSITANANRWDGALAWQFWAEQARLRGPLGVAGMLTIISIWLLTPRHRRIMLMLPVLYTLAGGVLAIGVGKVGAYTNYFLEFYIGLVWLAAVGVRPPQMGQTTQPRPSPRPERVWSPLPNSVLLVLVLASLLFYPPTWSKTTLHRAGLVEPNPPQLAFGRYALWDELKREWEVLAALRRVFAALSREVQATGSPLFTDVPGVAAVAGTVARVQLFEHRQLLDQGHWDQRAVLLELANGTLPLAVIDYLGNWLTPQMVAIIQHRYAQDGSLGTFDLYRPVEPGARVPVDIPFGPHLRLSAYHRYHPGDPPGDRPGGSNGARRASPVAVDGILVVTLVWEKTAGEDAGTGLVTEDLVVVLRLTDEHGHVVAESRRPLVYGSLPPATWPVNTPVQHMQPLSLPPDLGSGSYRLVVALRAAGDAQTLGSPQALTRVQVQGDTGGAGYQANGHLIPPSFARAWDAWGGTARAGVPLTPVVPLEWGRFQCFEYLCLEERDGTVRPRPLGAWLYQAETRRSSICGRSSSPRPGLPVCPGLWEVWQEYGGEEHLGKPVSGDIERNGLVVQWTRHARLERSPDGSYTGVGRLGEEFLALSPGQHYGWPGE